MAMGESLASYCHRQKPSPSKTQTRLWYATMVVAFTVLSCWHSSRSYKYSELTAYSICSCLASSYSVYTLRTRHNLTEIPRRILFMFVNPLPFCESPFLLGVSCINSIVLFKSVSLSLLFDCWSPCVLIKFCHCYVIPGHHGFSLITGGHVFHCCLIPNHHAWFHAFQCSLIPGHHEC